MGLIGQFGQPTEDLQIGDQRVHFRNTYSGVVEACYDDADAWEREPFIRLRQYLSDNGHWDEATEKAWLVECATRVDAEVNAYLESKPQPVESMFDYLYAELPADLEQQRAAALAREAK